MSKQMKNLLIILFAFISSIVLAIILIPLGGYLHLKILNVPYGGGIFLLEMGDIGSSLDGFVYFYIFWLAIFTFSLLKQKTAWIVYAIGTILLWVESILIIANENVEYQKNEDIGSLIIMICMFAIGWLLAQGGLIIYKKLKK